MNKKIENTAAILLGMLMLTFGINKFSGFIAVEPPSDPTAQQFMGAMFSSYLFVVVAIAEITGGILLLIPRFRFAGWLIQGVIIFNIVAFHIAHDFIGNGIWLLPTLLFLVVGFFQIKNISKIFNGKTLKVSSSALLLILCLNTSAQSDNYVSTKVENCIVLDKPASQVWELISNVENLSLLVPGVIKKVEANGNGVYASWLIYLQNDLLIKEEMTYFNSEEMEFSYVMTKTPMPLSDYLAIQKVEKINADKSKVTFTTYFNSNRQNKDNLRTSFNSFQNAFLNNIKKELE